jgi:hypothetical protein
MRNLWFDTRQTETTQPTTRADVGQGSTFATAAETTDQLRT